MTHLKVSSPKNAEEAAKKLFSMGCNSVIITLGENGAVYGEKKNSKFVHVPAMKVNAVDTTVSSL